MTEKNGRHPRKDHEAGFTLVEAVIGIFLISVAVLGLAQLFLITVLNNMKSAQISNATYLAQEQIEHLRVLTEFELSAIAMSPLSSRDELLDINRDGTPDYRRVTDMQDLSSGFEVRVLVFSAEKIHVPDPADLVAEPERHRVRALITTVITR